ncbi:endonuclease domain-containing protein [Pseudomarimonas arenosa]|uniref:Endonuclease domain-containing protein n=1 Tax=Pseudomarimonas arenosa TaxID=2774145 RepID=A0AAW3ZIG1_9GAMM|nr:DUF559 domain-containing protein [Pseudomarimonas arenosa]MBD8524922.1 endonuclease domain-containing protein [Pseudomarimonas arenosa]
MANRVILPLPSEAKNSARDLRSMATEAEQALWFQLRGGRFAGIRFRRKHPVPPCIADFCCLQAKLIVELDGSQQSNEIDGCRDAQLRGQGFEVIRVCNNQVCSDLNSALEYILTRAQARTLTPDPSPTGRGENSGGVSA